MSDHIRWRACAVFILLLLAALQPAYADSLDLSTEAQFKILPQRLATALVEFSRQAGAPIVSDTKVVGAFDTAGITGRMSLRNALQALLQGTRLGFKVTESGSIAVGAFSDGALAAPDPAEGSSTLSTEASASIEEIVVTAQKRLERLQDVPVPVTAISAVTLVNSNQLRLQDYFSRIPGLSAVPVNSSGGAPQLAIRGVTTGGFTNPTVGIVVDDVTYSSASTQGGGLYAPDLDPGDLARIEVLRGPQGTLYGASSIGGLLKFVTVAPSTDDLTGRVEAGVSGVEGADDLGYSVRGSINVPLGATFAIRASGFTRRDPGYVDNPVLGIEDVNRREAEGGRLSALWRPSDALSLTVSALLQDTSRTGSEAVYVQPGLGDLEQNAPRGTGTYDRKSQVYSATFGARLGAIELTSATGYSIDEKSSNESLPSLAGLTLSRFQVSGTSVPLEQQTNRFTQEVRLSGPIGLRFDWLFGLFYTHESSPTYHQKIVAVDPATGVRAGEWLDSTFDPSFSEYAAFGDLTIHFTDRFDLQVGARQSRNQQTYANRYTGPLVPLQFRTPSPFVTPELESRDDALTYLVTPRFKASDDLMLYARFASGYRPGGPVPTCALLRAFGSAVSCEFGPDKTRNYELGLKADLLDHMLSIDASVYYIDWKNIQLQLFDSTALAGYFENAGGAKSQGAELSLEARPRQGLTVSGWVAWNDATLTEAFPPTSTARGRPGDRLPFSSRFSGNLSLDQEFSLTSTLSFFIGGSVSYVGDRKGDFTPAQRQTYPSYAQTDLRAGLSSDQWAANLYVNNVTDRRGLIGGGLGATIPFAFNYIQPRTAGFSVIRKF